MSGQFGGIVHALDVQHDDGRALAVYVVLIHVLEGVLDSDLGAVAHGEHLVEVQAELHGGLEDEYDGRSGTGDEGRAHGAVLLESGGEDDDRLAGLLVAEGLHCGQTHLRGDGEDGAVHGRKQLYVPVGLDSLGRVALGVDDIQLSGIVSVQKILEGGSTRLVDIVRTSDDHNAFRRD